MRKQVLAGATVMMMLCALPVATVHAEPELEEPIIETVAEEYTYTRAVSSVLSFSGSTASCQSNVFGYNNCTKIVGTQKLQKKVLWWWSDVQTWSKTSYSNTLYMSNSATVTSSGTYRVRIDATVYGNDGGSETVYAVSTEKTK